MKTEKEIGAYRMEIEEKFGNAETRDAMKYYQGALRALEWITTGKNV